MWKHISQSHCICLYIFEFFSTFFCTIRLWNRYPSEFQESEVIFFFFKKYSQNIRYKNLTALFIASRYVRFFLFSLLFMLWDIDWVDDSLTGLMCHQIKQLFKH